MNERIKRGEPGYVNPMKGVKATPEQVAARLAGRRLLSVEERYWPKVDRRGADECWPWLGAKNKGGYGVFYYNGRDDMAHRVSLRLSGVEVPYSDRKHSAGVVDHICRNVACVNPAHLRLTSQWVNTIANSDSSSAINARRTHCSRANHPLVPGNVAWVPQRNGQAGFARVCLTCHPGIGRRSGKVFYEQPIHREAA